MVITVPDRSLNIVVVPVLPLVMPLPPVLAFLRSSQLPQLPIAFGGPFLLVLFGPLQLGLSLLHEGEWIARFYASLLPLFAPRIFIAPDVLVLELNQRC
jgi:hypothetical protein